MLPQTPFDRLLAAGTLLCAAALAGMVTANRDALQVERHAAATPTTRELRPRIAPAARRAPVTTLARPHVAPAAAATTPPRRLSITAARGPSWLEVRATSADGAQLHYGLLPRGQTKTFDRLPVWVRAGALQNLDLRLGQTSVRSLPAADGGVSDFVASAAGVADTG